MVFTHLRKYNDFIAGSILHVDRASPLDLRGFLDAVVRQTGIRELRLGVFTYGDRFRLFLDVLMAFLGETAPNLGSLELLDLGCCEMWPHETHKCRAEARIIQQVQSALKGTNGRLRVIFEKRDIFLE